MRNRRHALGVLVVAGGLLAGGLAAGSPTSAAPSTTPVPAGVFAAPETVEISVMSQNIFYGGDDYDLQTGEFCEVADGCIKALRELADIIVAADADVVGIQETERNVGRLARRLGWFASPRAHVISRFPIIDPPHSNGLYVFVAPTPGRVVAVANVHLPSTPYGPYEVRDGATREQLREIERKTRLGSIQTQLDVLPKLAAKGIPVVLTGDFNSPSHLDWTPAVDAIRTDVHYPFKWPVSRALANGGFVDSYREVYPDPVARPGFTWTPGGPETDPQEVFDRIDWVLHAGPATTVDSRLVGETGGADVDLGFDSPYPSDHRGVVSTLEVAAAEPPNLVMVDQRRLTIGSPLTVTIHAPGKPGEHVVVARRLPGGGHDVVRSKPTGPEGTTDGWVFFETIHGIERGTYDVMLIDRDGRLLSKTPFWAYPPGSTSELSTSRSTYREGHRISVRWTHAPGMGLDWIGLFRCDAAHCEGNGRYLLYGYTGTRVQGSLTIGRGNATNEGSASWPLPPGEYVARLLVDDSYKSIGQSPRFTIVEE